VNEQFGKIEEYLPHRGRMLWLTGIQKVNTEEVWLNIDTNCRHMLFVESHGIPSWAGIEYMAQATAVFGALRASRYATKAYLISCRRFETNVSYFSEGFGNLVSVKEIAGGLNHVATFQCMLHAESGAVLAEGRLTVHIPDVA